VASKHAVERTDEERGSRTRKAGSSGKLGPSGRYRYADARLVAEQASGGAMSSAQRWTRCTRSGASGPRRKWRFDCVVLLVRADFVTGANIPWMADTSLSSGCRYVPRLRLRVSRRRRWMS